MSGPYLVYSYSLLSRGNILRGVVHLTPPWFRAWVASRIRGGASSCDIRNALRPVSTAQTLCHVYDAVATAGSGPGAGEYTDFETFHAQADVDYTHWAIDGGGWSVDTARSRTRDIYDQMVLEGTVPQSLVVGLLRASHPGFDNVLRKARDVHGVLCTLHAAEATLRWDPRDDMCIQSRHVEDVLGDMREPQPSGEARFSRLLPGLAMDDMTLGPGGARRHGKAARSRRPAPNDWRSVLRNPALRRVPPHLDT
jgi:hypothetical protein